MWCITYFILGTALLLFCSGIPTSTSFVFSPSSWTPPPTSKEKTCGDVDLPPRIRGVTPTAHRGVPLGRRQYFTHRRWKSSRRSVSDTAEGTARTEKHYTIPDLHALGRSELQGLCKKFKLRAVGKNSELILRLQEQQMSSSSISTASRDPLASSEADTLPAGKNSNVPTLPVEKTPAGGVEPRDDSSHDDGYTSPVMVDSQDIRPTPVAQAHLEESLLRPRPTGGGTFYNADEDAALLQSEVEGIRPMLEHLSDEQWAKVAQLGQLLTEWNGRVNLISRKDIANVMMRHVMPCLAMAKALKLEDGVDVLDVGTGGGLPGLPMAISYPKVQFTLIDGTGKKINAVQDMAQRLGLDNVRAFHIRAEEVHEQFDYVMGRAVTSLPKFVGFIDKNLKRNPPDSAETEERAACASLRRGVLYMRGEVSEDELRELGAQPSTVISLERYMGQSPEEDVGDRGYSSVFHFTSESIWGRHPVVGARDPDDLPPERHE